MGQACSCGASAVEDHIAQPSLSFDIKYEDHKLHPPRERQDARASQDTEDDADVDDEFWEARSDVSLASCRSSFSVEDFIEQWQHELHGDISEVREEVAAATRTHGHLVPHDVEEAACRGTIPTKSMAIPTSMHHYESSIPYCMVRQEVSTVKVYEALLCARDHQRRGRIVEAHSALVALCADLDIDVQDLCSSALLGSLSAHPLPDGLDIAALLSHMEACTNALEHLSDDHGWMVSRKGKLRVWYKHITGTTVHGIKVKAVFPHAVGHIVAMAHEWDLLPTWNRFALEALKLATRPAYECFVYGAQWIPRPFRHMQALIKARGFDLAQSHRSLLILVNDVTPEELPHGHAPLSTELNSRRTVQILNGSSIKLRPLPRIQGGDARPRTEAELCMYLDPHIPYVPAILLNFVLGILAPYIFNQVNKVLDATFGDGDGVNGQGANNEFIERVKAQPGLYGMIEQRMNDFADELGI